MSKKKSFSPKKLFSVVLASVSDVTIVDFHLHVPLMPLNELNVLFAEQMPPLVLGVFAILLLVQFWIEWMPAICFAELIVPLDSSHCPLRSHFVH
jgi:hypothetical protein